MATALAANSDSRAITPALDQIRAALGDNSVIADRASLAKYVDSGSLAGPDAPLPGAAVMPTSVEHVRALLAIATQHRIGLWPLVGSGPFAASADRAGQLVVVDPQRMNRILEVNEKYAYALVEPGVTYAQLHDRLRDGNPPLWLDCASQPSSSPASDFVNRSFGYTPYNDHVIMQCGLEAVLPDGSLVRTGMGAMPKSSSWQLFKYGYGPYTDGSFTQSSLGIMTKIGIWLMPAPPACQPFMITIPREEDLHAAIDILKPLKITMLIPNTVVVSHLLDDAALSAPRSKYDSGSGPISASAAAKIASDTNRGMWNIYGALYGVPPGIAVGWKVIQDAFSKIPKAGFYTNENRKDDPVFAYRSQLMCGVPAAPPSTTRQWNAGGHAEISQVIPLTGAHAARAFDLAKGIAREHKFDYPCSFQATWRSAFLAGTIPFDPNSADDRKRAQACAKSIVERMAKSGYGTVAAPAEIAAEAASTYSAHNGAFWNMHRKLKAEFDPRDVLASPFPLSKQT
ncbi:MAG: FAD-binding oxidoreductase [Candidatus Binataceae bacterium]|nr:FAD-binding oxidoreductase [Candidatus Binataceae bacterium]